MSIFSIFSKNKELKIFVDQSLDNFCTSFPSNYQSNKNDKKLNKKFDKAINRLKHELLNYRKNNNLGVYKKAKLISLVIQGMQDRGYDQKLINDIKTRVTTYITSS